MIKMPSKSYAGTVGFFLWGNIRSLTQFTICLFPSARVFFKNQKNGELHEKKYFDLRKTLIDINPSEARLSIKASSS